MIATLTEGTGLRIGRAIAPEGTENGPTADLYPALITGIAGALSDCLLR